MELLVRVRELLVAVSTSVEEEVRNSVLGVVRELHVDVMTDGVIDLAGVTGIRDGAVRSR